MTFGEALEALKNGKLVRRAGWNGKGMHVYLEDTMVGPLGHRYEPFLVMFTAQKKHQPGWLASQADMLANDWEVVTATASPEPLPATMSCLQQSALAAAPNPGDGRMWVASGVNFGVRLVALDDSRLLGGVEPSPDGWVAVLPFTKWKKRVAKDDPRAAMLALLDAIEEES